MPRKKRRWSDRKLILIVGLGVAAVYGLLFAAGAYFAWQSNQANRAAKEQLEAELEADRVDARAAFADATPPTPEETAEFQQFFAQLGSAIVRRRNAQTAEYVDTNRMAHEIGRMGGYDRLLFGERRTWKIDTAKNLRDGIGAILVENEDYRWQETEIRRVRWSPDRKEAAVIVVHRHRDGDTEKRLRMRWWLISTGNGWKLYDFEELELCCRYSIWIGSLAAVDRDGTMEKSADHLAEAMTALNKKDSAKAERCLALCRGAAFPPPYEASRELILGVLAFNKGEYETALQHYAAADRHWPGKPNVMLHQCIAYDRLERHEEAVERARAYIAEIGPDAGILTRLARGFEGLSRIDEAANSYRAALDDDPDEVAALHGLRRMLPRDKKREIVDRLRRAKRADAHFDALLREARSDDDDEGARTLLEWLRDRKPDDSRILTEDIRTRVNGKKYDEAKSLLLEKLKVVPADQQVQLVNVYLYAMLRANEVLDAYAAMPKERASSAFQTLAGDLEDSLFEFDRDPPPPAIAQLTALIAAHRAAMPDDPWLAFYDGALLEWKQEHAAAEKSFAAGMKQAETRGESTETFRYRRVNGFYAMNRGLDGYLEVGPANATFRQLASRYDMDKDVAGLEALIAAHRKRAPTDPALIYWDAELKYLSGRYSEAATGFAEYRARSEAKSTEAARLPERWVRSLLRANAAADAQNAIREVGEENIWIALRAAVEAKAGNVAAVERMMEEQSKKPGGVWSFYSDEDMGAAIAGEAFAELRKKHPDPRPRPMAGKAG